MTFVGIVSIPSEQTLMADDIYLVKSCDDINSMAVSGAIVTKSSETIT